MGSGGGGGRFACVRVRVRARVCVRVSVRWDALVYQLREGMRAGMRSLAFPLSPLKVIGRNDERDH